MGSHRNTFQLHGSDDEGRSLSLDIGTKVQ